MDLHRILVVLGTDYADWHTNHPLLRRAVSLGERFSAGLVLLHVAYEHTLGFGTFAERDAIEAGRLKLLAGYRERQEGLSNAIASATGLEAVTETHWSHDRSGCILEIARARQADLILKQSGAHAYVLGLFSTTDWDLVRAAEVPVWFVPRESRRLPSDGIVAAVDQTFIDDDSDQALALDQECFETAKMLSDRFRCPLFAVHSYLVPNVLGGYEAMLPIPTTTRMPSQAARAARQHDRTEIARRHREVVLDFIDEHGIPLDDVIVREGHVDQVLTSSARALSVGLIVMGSSNKSWWDRLLGRVNAEPTLANAPCDVLFVRPG